MPIALLSEELRSQIAAGEVVERPVSVVKELVENALDAGANHIQVRIIDAGLSLIEVSDNGEGIPSGEIELAITRHATSKLHSTKDLNEIQSLGFRGEALAAIASISRFTLKSRFHKAEEGMEIRIEAGKVQKLQATSSPPGSTIRVEDLFFNVPARKKFQKSERSERGRIYDLLVRYALARADVRFSFESEGKYRLQSSGNGDQREVLANIYDAKIAKRMLPVDSSLEQIKVSGFISPLDISKANRSAINLFVNGRWIRDVALSSAVLQGYRGMLMVGRFPLASIFVDLPADQIDVNVHPAKSEIHFQQSDMVFRAVQGAVKKAIMAHTPIQKFDPKLRWHPQEKNTTLNFETADQDVWLDASSNNLSNVGNQAPLPKSEISLFRLVGQVGQTYIVAEAPDGIYLVDQHAAHERILFEKFQSQGKQMESQILLEAVQVELNAKESEDLMSQLGLLNSIGFQVENFGPQHFVIRAIPSLLIGSDPEAALRSIVEDFEEDEQPLESQQEAKLIARICKRAAVKGGQFLSSEEQQAILSDLENCISPRTCPHGRPTMIHLSVDVLEKQFGRKGAR